LRIEIGDCGLVEGAHSPFVNFNPQSPSSFVNLNRRSIVNGNRRSSIVKSNRRSSIVNGNRRSSISIASHQSQSAIANHQIGKPQSAICNRL
jgi:hypothetical protein